MADGAMASVPMGARARAWEVWAQLALDSSVRMFGEGRISLAPPAPSDLQFGATALAASVALHSSPVGAARRTPPLYMEFRRRRKDEWNLLRRCAATLLHRTFDRSDPTYEFPEYPAWIGVPEARWALIEAYGEMAKEVKAVVRVRDREAGDPGGAPLPHPHMAGELERAGMLVTLDQARALFRELRGDGVPPAPELKRVEDWTDLSV